MNAPAAPATLNDPLVVADLHAGWDFYAFVDDRPPHMGVAADIDAFEQD